MPFTNAWQRDRLPEIEVAFFFAVGYYSLIAFTLMVQDATLECYVQHNLVSHGNSMECTSLVDSKAISSPII